MNEIITRLNKFGVNLNTILLSLKTVLEVSNLKKVTLKNI